MPELEGYTTDGDQPPSTPSSPRRKARFSDTPLPLTASSNLTGNSSSPPTQTIHSPTSTRSNSPEPLATPGLSESAGKLRKNLSFKNLKELDVKELKQVVYRKGSRGEMKKYRPKSDDEVFAHALRGGLREFPTQPLFRRRILGRIAKDSFLA